MQRGDSIFQRVMLCKKREMQEVHTDCWLLEGGRAPGPNDWGLEDP